MYFMYVCMYVYYYIHYSFYCNVNCFKLCPLYLNFIGSKNIVNIYMNKLKMYILK